MSSTTKRLEHLIETKDSSIDPCSIKKPIVFRLKRRKTALRIKSRESSKSCKPIKTKLWSDKHKPQKLEELVGNCHHIRTLKKWLQNWDTNHRKILNNKRSKGSPYRKATLIVGPPGIGKSSSIALIAQSMGYEVVELNADIISKKMLETTLHDITQNTILSFKTKNTKNTKKRLIVMDEVDNMSSGSNVIPALIVAIKNSKTPIICICNDVQKSSVRSLSKHCLVLKFVRPQQKTIVKHLVMVAKKEGMNVESKALRVLVESTGCDIRQILNSMQMWNSGGDMTYANIKARKSEICKDEIQRISVFDAASHLLACPRNASFCRKRDELFFVDHNIMPLFIHMNYITSILSGNHKKNKILNVMSESADLIAEADIYDSYIYMKDRPDLLTKQAVTISAVGFKTRGRVGWCKFPETLGKLSTMKKRKHLLSEFVARTGLRTLSSKTSMRLDYLIPLRNHCIRPLSTLHAAEGVKQTVASLREYGFTYNTFEGLSEFGLGEEKKRDLFSGSSLKSKIKAAFT